MKAKKGEYDYDFRHDILYFGAKKREYKNSIELDNVVVDFDPKGNVYGVQIFEASKYLQIDKDQLEKLQQWMFSAEIHEKRLTIRLVLQVKQKDKIIEKNPIIQQMISIPCADSAIICEN
ncbi:hypothetical protein COV16_06750 [Candidatus Woesearchaeota archaeon CG10_big_fil_rev_8_21_14_0_10_34_8]|nr:MAG: hypothetical protein COV16_06750 [Candidatus Woesearchaeota archaeon CG10_big_fil_rev_8_21_14_0_10_34_8]